MSVRVITGDCRDVLPTLPADSFDCVVTSPPYWGLRDYGIAGQIGLEPTLEGYVEEMALIGREIWRVLKPGGTFWLNIGDCYATGAGKVGEHPGGGAQGARWRGSRGDAMGKHGYRGSDTVGPMTQPNRLPQAGLKPKDLCLIPARVALRLQADGWWVRSEIIWHKPAPMPESVTDRPTCAHEKVWLLTKGERYFYDAGAIAEPVVKGYAGSSFTEGKTGVHQLGRASTKPRKGEDKQQDIADNSNVATARRMGGFNNRWEAKEEAGAVSETRNARNVWTIASEPYRGAHYAVMPSALAERCIKAGCPKGGSVLDPFGGAGTTGLVADRLGRHATLIELNPANREMAAERVTMDGPLFAEVSS